MYEMPFKTFVMVLKKVPDHFNLLALRRSEFPSLFYGQFVLVFLDRKQCFRVERRKLKILSFILKIFFIGFPIDILSR